MRAASSYVAPSERGKEKKREREGRDGARKRGRQRKYGGGRGTPCFDPRKRRRQSRRVLGSIPQGGRHSAALKPSVSSLPHVLPRAPSVFLGAIPSPPSHREPPIPTSLTLSLLDRSVSLFRPLSLRSPCTRYILRLFLPFSPALRRYSLSVLAFSTSLSSHSREGKAATPEAEARS